MHNIAYPGAHLLIFQLVKEASPPSNRVNLKPELFYFVTLAPGAGRGADRTYDFQNKVNIKFGIHEILALSFALHCAAVGNLASIVGYNKFARSNETKSVTIGIAEKTSKFGNQRQITLFVSAGSAKHAFAVDATMASAMSTQLEMSAKLATQMEFTRVSNASSYVTSVPEHQTMQAQSNRQPIQATPQPMHYQQVPQQIPPTAQPMMSQTNIVDDFSNMLSGV